MRNRVDLRQKRGWTRRQIAAAVTLPVPLLAQEPVASSELNQALEQVKRNAEILRRFRVPILTEPSFAFKP
jgi:hypothetical protein